MKEYRVRKEEDSVVIEESYDKHTFNMVAKNVVTFSDPGLSIQDTSVSVETFKKFKNSKEGKALLKIAKIAHKSL